jgi:hypothetical protein
MLTFAFRWDCQHSVSCWSHLDGTSYSRTTVLDLETSTWCAQTGTFSLKAVTLNHALCRHRRGNGGSDSAKYYGTDSIKTAVRFHCSIKIPMGQSRKAITLWVDVIGAVSHCSSRREAIIRHPGRKGRMEKPLSKLLPLLCVISTCYSIPRRYCILGPPPRWIAKTDCRVSILLVEVAHTSPLAFRLVHLSSTSYTCFVLYLSS